MDPYIYEIKLPAKLADMLKGMVDLARKNEVITLRCDRPYGPHVTGYVYDITAGSETKSFGQDTDYALYGLSCLNLIAEREDSKVIFLTSDAHEWVRYNRMSPIKKFAYRYWPGWQYVIQGLFGALIASIPVLWVFFQFLYYFGYLQVKP